MSPSDTEVDGVLAHGDLLLEGRLVGASNASFVGTVEGGDLRLRCVYKPVAGERPLWDFPDGTLAGRERAARVLSAAGGWDVVPPTVLREGRFGTGMVQQWVDVAPEHVLVDVVAAEFDEPGWLPVLEAQDVTGDPVLLVHADDPRLRSMAVFDVIANNADRKGGHVLVTADGLVHGCDHGVCFHEEPKLRTVLWGWGGQPLREVDRRALDRVEQAWDRGLSDQLAAWLSATELDCLAKRVAELQESGTMPLPDGSWPAIPWPPF